ncbi:MAG: PAS domain S-box protein [Magnetococcus sp. YQC-5]
MITIFENTSYFEQFFFILTLSLLYFLIYLSYRLLRTNQILRTNERTIKHLHQQNELILNSAGDGIFGLDQTGRITFINPSAARMLHRTRESLLQTPVQELLPKQTAVPKTSAMERTIQFGAAESGNDEWFVLPDGTLFPIEYHCTPLFVANNSAGAVVTFRDITQYKQTEEELHGLASAVRQSADMILITNAQGIVHYVNPSFESLSGYRREEVIGVNAAFLQCDKQSSAFYFNLVRRLQRGETWKNRFVTKRKDGGIMHVDVAISPIRDRHGEVTHFVGAARDVTREEELSWQLRKSQRLEAIGVLAGGIAHDFNNILTAILSYAELTLDDVPVNSPSQHNLNEILVATVRAKDLVKRLLTFSRRDEGERMPLKLGPVIREAMNLLQAVVPETIQVRTRLTEDERPVLADATRIHQVVMNLGTNAAQSMWNQGGLLEVKLDRIHIDAARKTSHAAMANVKAGDYMCITVQDTGTGIAPEMLDRIFEPFFTTRGPGNGSGLGLSVVHGIVQSHEGSITLESEVGVGSCFCIYLPTTHPSIQNNPPHPSSRPNTTS